MGRRSNKTQKSKTSKSTATTTTTTNNNTNTSTTGGGWLYVDPRNVLFQHSKIRPIFSGCGRSVVRTLQSIRDGDLEASDLPPIQVLPGPPKNDNGGGDDRWYFSLNNRRLWILKQCREEGLLGQTTTKMDGNSNLIKVRVRDFKSRKEMERYTLENCALNATFMRERDATATATATANANGVNVRGVNDVVKGNDENDDCDDDYDYGTENNGEGGINDVVIKEMTQKTKEMDITKKSPKNNDDDRKDDDYRDNLKEEYGNSTESDEDESDDGLVVSREEYKNPFCLGDDDSSSSSSSDDD